ncbi:MAG: hypothetical protein C0430_08205 [Flavobacterium sp.]|nr:hypothetical protein [Flavobacterium sp.]
MFSTDKETELVLLQQEYKTASITRVLRQAGRHKNLEFCAYSIFVWADSLVLRNPPLRQDAKR